MLTIGGSTSRLMLMLGGSLADCSLRAVLPPILATARYSTPTFLSLKPLVDTGCSFFLFFGGPIFPLRLIFPTKWQFLSERSGQVRTPMFLTTFFETQNIKQMMHQTMLMNKICELSVCEDNCLKHFWGFQLN